MAWSNIYLELITLTGPVIGEGLLEGWETSIELDSFGWGMSYQPDPKATSTGLSSVLGPVGAMFGIGGNRARMHELTMDKRFDISSAMIHTCIDNHLPIISASITVLNIKQGGRSIHEPGFTLVATNGHFIDAQLSMSSNGHAVEVKEHLTLQFETIVVSYLKRVGKDNIPTNPFFYTNPKQTPSSPSL